MQFCLSEIACLFYCLVIKFLPSLIWSKHKSFFLLWGSIVDFGCLFSLSFRHVLYICKMVTLFSVYQGNSRGVWTTLVLVTVLLMFLYFLVLPWMCLLYCFLNLDIAFYLNKQKPVHAFPPFAFSGWESQGMPTQKRTTWVLFWK